MAKVGIRSVGYQILNTKGMKVSFKVNRFDRENAFYYKEWLWHNEKGEKALAAELTPGSMIQITLRNVERKDSQKFILFQQHRKRFLLALRKILNIFSDYELMSVEEKRSFKLYDVMEGGLLQINNKHRNPVTVHIYGDVMLKVAPTIISYSGGNYNGVMLTLRDKTFRYKLEEVEDLYDIVDEVRYSELTLALLAHAPKVEHGKYVLQLRPESDNRPSTIQQATQRVKTYDSFGDIRTK